MRIDVTPPDAWGRLSEQYRAALPLKEPALNVQVYAGIGHAISEVTKSLGKLFTHKKTIAVVQGVDPAFNSVAVAFSEEGYVVKNISAGEAAKAATWLPLMDELLFVLVCDDDPITGRKYEFDSSAFAQKRVFRLRVSHEAHKWQMLKRPDPFEAIILGLAPDRALLVAGERCKVEPQLAPALHWRTESEKEIAESLAHHSSDSVAQNLIAIETFEAGLPSGFKAYFKKGESRVPDRVVIYHPDFDGSAVIDEVASTMQITVARPGEPSALETTSACRWESPRFYDWLIARGESDATARGLVTISSDLIGKGLKAHLETAAARLMRLQNG